MTTNTIDYDQLADNAADTYTSARDALNHAAANLAIVDNDRRGYQDIITADDAPATANNTEHTPTVAARTWHYTAMSAATFTLSALLAYIATEATCKRIRGRNN